MKSVTISLLLLFAYVNSVIFSGLLLYPELPRFISVLVVFLVLPIVLVFVFRYLSRLLIVYLNLDVQDEEQLVSPLPIFAGTLALPMVLVLFADFAGGNYLYLIQNSRIKDVSIIDAENYTNAGYVEFMNGRVELTKAGLSQSRTGSNNGSTRSITIHSYYVYPVVTRDWNSNMPISIWLCESISNPESMSSKYKDYPKVPGMVFKKVQGIPIHDSYAIHSYSGAIENATRKHNIKSVSNPLLLAYQKNPYPQLLEKQRVRFFIFLGVVNLLWVGGFGFLIIRDFKSKPQQDQKLNELQSRDLQQKPLSKGREKGENIWSGKQAALASVFVFSMEDLSSNQLGRISVEQKSRMHKNNTSNTKFAWGVFTAIISIGFFGFLAGIIQNDEMQIDALLWYFVAVGFFALILWAGTLFHQHRLKCTLEKGIARSVRGIISLYSERVERSTNYYFSINNHRFEIVEFRQFNALKKQGVVGYEATMYISSPWKSILSVELHEQ